MKIFNSATTVKVDLNTNEFMIISYQELSEISAHAERMLDGYKIPQSLRTNAYVDFYGKELYGACITQPMCVVGLRLRRRSDKKWEITRAAKAPVHARTRKKYFIWLTERQRLEAAKRVLKAALKNSGVFGASTHR
jgi:hypothetical protein